MKTANVAEAFQYAESVIRGDIVACKYVRLACQRHINDLKKADDENFPYFFDHKAAEKKIQFVHKLPHVKGKWAFQRKLIILQPWQKLVIALIFGWKKKKNKLRRFREVYLEVPRKNGKSILAAAIGLIGFVFDNEFGAEVYAGATSEKQAWEVFRPARLMVSRTPELQSAFGIQVSASNMCCLGDGSRFEPIIGNPGDGSSPHLALIDEFHEHDSPDLYDTMSTGMDAREQPLIVAITTAGKDIEGPCYEKRRQMIDMLEGVMPDDELLGLIYTIDEDDDWTTESALRKANPNFGVSLYEDGLLSKQRKAVALAAQQNTFKTKHLNIWTNAREAYFNIEDWKKCTDTSLRLEDFYQHELIESLDMASKQDILARVRCFPKTINGKRHYFIVAPQFYIPENAIAYCEESGAQKRYEKWQAMGLLEVEDGAENDFGAVAQDVIDDMPYFALKEVPHDPWGAFEIAHVLSAEGLLPIKIDQNVRNLSPAMKEIKAAMAAGRLYHDGNPILTWMISNVVAKEDKNENVFPCKEKKSSKIDGAVGLIMCVNRAMLDPKPEYQSPYEDGVYL